MSNENIEKLKLFSERLMVEEVEEDFEGVIIMPESRQQMHLLGRIVKTSDKVDKEYGYAKTGSLVTYQVNAVMAKNNEVKVGETSYLILHPKDIIGILNGTVVNLENFKIAGEWVLLRPKVAQSAGVIELPEQTVDQHSDYMRWTIEQTGEKCADFLEVGKEVFVQKGRCHEFTINGDPYFYIHQDSLHGMMT